VALTIATEGHGPTRLANGWDPPRAAAYVAPSRAPLHTPPRHQLGTHSRPDAAHTAPPRGRLWVARAVANPPASPIVVKSGEGSLGTVAQTRRRPECLLELAVLG
jgi:hypothetical protein